MGENDQSNAAGRALASRRRDGKYLTFILGRESYGLEILKVREIIGSTGITITTLPHMTAEVKGVINLRGSVIPIIDLRLRFGMPDRAYDRETCIIVISVRSYLIGIAVDTVSEVLDIQEGKIDDPPDIGGNIDTGFLLGLGKVAQKVIMLLDIEKVLMVDGLGLSAVGNANTTQLAEVANV